MAYPQDLPDDVRAVIDRYRVCEFSTLTKDGTPITHPLCAGLLDDGRFMLSTSIGLPTKAFNIRRNPKVGLLYSDPTGSGLTGHPTVLVQGDATAPEELISAPKSDPEFEAYFFQIVRRQPDSPIAVSWPMRGLTWWYWVRIQILVAPRRITWWPNGDQSQTPQTIDLKVAA